jgi:hypothetical protein
MNSVSQTGVNGHVTVIVRESVQRRNRMSRGKWRALLTVAGVMILAGCLQNVIPEPGIPRMAKEELRPLMGTPGVIILDVREPDDWNKSREKIAGAVREDPEKDVKTWAEKYPKDKTLVFY